MRSLLLLVLLLQLLLLLLCYTPAAAAAAAVAAATAVLLLLLLLRFEVGVRWHTILECTLGVLTSFVKPHTEKPPLAMSRSFVLQT